MKQVLALALIANLTGCASIVGDKLQPVALETTVDATALNGANCTLENDAGKWYVTTPGTVTIHKSTGDLAVSCVKDSDLVGTAAVVSRSNTAVWGNLVFGGLIGYVVDRETGAGFNYPSTIHVPMRKSGATAGASAPVAGTQ